jgi:gliding motility-associated protein GldM
MPASNAPETPRQRMIGLMYLMLLCLLALNVSSEVLHGFELVDDSLTTSTENSSSQNNMLYDDFSKSYKANPEKVKEWYNQAQDLKRRSDQLFNMLSQLKLEVVQEADGKKSDIHNVKRSDNLDAAAIVLLPPNSHKGRDLKIAIENYRDYIVKLVDDDLQRKVILDNFSTTPSKRAKKSGMTWENAMFENMPVGAVVTIFTKLQNDIRYAEGEVLHVLADNVDVRDFRVNQIKAYVIPNSENVVRGGMFKANIILSAEDSTQRPDVYVNGRMLDPNKRGFFEMMTSKSGTFPLKGYLQIKRADGTMQQYPFEKKFTVVEPMATVSNTLMNVLYAGINNQVSISVPGVPNSQISATSNNGSLTRSGDVWIAKPTGIGKPCLISVSAMMDGRSRQVAQMNFRVRPLPEPRAFILYTDNSGIERRYKGGTGFSKAKLLTTPGIIAALDDDLLEVNFSVLSFKTLIYDSMGNTMMEDSNGSHFSDRQITQIRGLVRGKRLWVSAIKAVGPDRVEQLLPPMEVIIN